MCVTVLVKMELEGPGTRTGGKATTISPHPPVSYFLLIMNLCPPKACSPVPLPEPLLTIVMVHYHKPCIRSLRYPPKKPSNSGFIGFIKSHKRFYATPSHPSNQTFYLPKYSAVSSTEWIPSPRDKGQETPKPLVLEPI